MDMHVFQVESNKVLPQQGSILISSPFMNDYHFTRAVVLLIEHNDEGSMGIIMNKDFRYHILLNDLIPELEFAQRVPVYKGGPVSRETIFFLHTLKDLEGALPLGNGLYLNGDFNAVQQYILDGKPIEGVIRFFAGYAGWDHGQLAKEIKENSWLIGKAGKETLLNQHFRDLWHTSLNEMGGKYAIWARYPNTPPSTEIQLLDNQHIRIATAKRMRPLFQYRTLFVPARRKESAGRKVFHSDIGKQLMNSQITETVFFQQSQGVTPYPLPATGFIHHNPHLGPVVQRIKRT